ncbi:hypothetical protein J2W14_002909 [Pseudarthrobacter oxydans]|uniref:PKD domain-containing protein n=1 Tax=Pseudarthrobacter oxydans TaxID=1671 RepID=UPI002780F8A2|nr:hypothetical protein [Pseudarthrobacter oxydans]MDP9983488.1 hypothetical protein [Pseudarthrobacter oxydans]
MFWNSTGVGVWRYDASTKVWVDAPNAVPQSPYQYRFDYLCLVDNNSFDVDCLAAATECSAGENGRPVRWWWKLVVAGPNDWSRIAPDRCVYSEKPDDVLGKIAAQIQTKFQQLPVSAGNSVMQPNPHTLRGAETNFYVEAAEQSFTVDMLGQSVSIVAKPVQYTWSYGDGTSLGPQTAAGGPLPQDRWGEKTSTSHVYTQTGDFSVVLTTHFQGTYSVNGGPPLPIPGQGQFSSPPQTVSVWRSITRNYADDCLRNPQGQGCPGVVPPAP